jgi:hypothetical protein
LAIVTTIRVYSQTIVSHFCPAIPVARNAGN